MNLNDMKYPGWYGRSKRSKEVNMGGSSNGLGFAYFNKVQ